MTLYSCSMHGIQPSGRAWSLRLGFTSAAVVSAVEASWLFWASSFWTDGAHGVDTLFPVGTVLQKTRTASLTIVTIGAVQKIREALIAEDNPALAGTSVNPSLPDQNAILTSFRTGMPGRENRGRAHLPAPDETLVLAGEMGAVPTTRVTTAFNALRGGMAGDGHQQVIVTYVKPLTGTPVGSTRTVTVAETDRVVRTLRGRVKRRPAVYA